MVRRDKNIPWEVIIRKFKCEISEKEQAELDVWLADVENHARFQSWQSLWLSIMEENMRYVSNVDALWKRMEERMRKAEPRMFKLSLRSFRLYIAAVAVLFFLLFSFAGYMTAEWYKASDAVLAYSSLNGKSRICLPDSTFVWLNAGSTLEYFVSRWTKERNVRLDGEAYFEVTHNEDKPFVVQTNKCNVEVLGTKFNVEAYSDSEDFCTSLMEGSVRVSDKRNPSETLVLAPNQQVSLINGHLQSKSIADFDPFRWKEGLICFKDMNFKELMSRFEKCYGIHVIIENPKLTDYICSGKFRISDGIDKALHILQKDAKYTFERNKDESVIYIK